MRVGSDLKKMNLDVSEKAMMAAIQDVMAGREPALDNEEYQAALNELREHLAQVRQQQEQAFEKEGEQAKAEGEAFLAKNAKREDVMVSDSGLQIKVIEEGEGKSPTPKSRVKVHYKGTFIDGTVFDSSYERGTPSEFQANQVIRGWTEALINMKEGGKVRIWAPSELAYGQKGRRSGSPDSPDIPPNSVLVFDIELLEVMQP
jgi:FKBP-type peptidyl-prolyl cis-trans isomerase